MKSIERRFKNIAKSNPRWSSYICFTEAIKNQRFSCRITQYWFNGLVKKNDYERSDKKSILSQLRDLNKPPEEGIK